jgi:hypothetical protein
MPTKFSKPLLIVSAVALVIAIGFAIVFAGRTLGEKEGKAAVERLQLLWPNVLTMSEPDRILLAKLSLDCNVSDVPAEKAAVRECLVHEASRSDSKIANAEQHLSRLLKMATP